MKIRAILAATALTSAFAFAACGGGSAPPATTQAASASIAPAPTVAALITVSGAWARLAVGPAPSSEPAMGGGMPAATGGMPMGGSADTSNSAVYMTIKSAASVADRLVAAQSDVAKAVELHTATMKDGVMEMRPVEAIEVPANGTVLLQPGGFHVMLIGLKRDLRLGDIVKLTLRFEKAGLIPVDASVKAQGG